jgi:hypothetical protein
VPEERYFNSDGRFSDYLTLTYATSVVVKGKAIPLQPLTGPEGSRRLRLTVFKTIDT